MIPCAIGGDKIESFVNDELQVFRGNDYFVKSGISIHQPCIEEICKYGEKDYFIMIRTLTSVPADLKWQLDKIGIDYTKISDYELFCNMLYKEFTKEQTRIIFGELDLQMFDLCQCENNSFLLFDKKNNLTIDEYTYSTMIDVLRKIHGFKRDNTIPGNESTKRILIEDAKDEYERNKDKEYRSLLKDLISAMTNSEGFKYNHSNVWNMKIHAFMDAVSRIQKIKNAELLFQSGYSGYGINLKDVDKKQLDWLGELD